MMRTRRAWTVGVAMAILGVTAVVAPASARPPLDDGDATGKGPLGGLSVAPPTLARLDARAPADATVGAAGLIADAAVELVPCDEEPSFLCGTVQVPLDRRNPDDRILGIAFAIVPHSGPQEVADGAIFVTCGGPGCSGTAIATFGFSFIFGDLLETMDVVYVDQRGVGLSEVIDCPELQSAGPLYESAAACHDQLGDTASLYSTSDVADDLDDVRAALGYEQIDVFGGSYAGVDMITYAVRHTEHVRSVVLASPAMVVGTDPFYPYAPEAMPGIAAGMCGRSPACAAEHRDAERDFAQAARQLRRRPVSGVGIDSAGFEHDMTVDENLLSNFIMYFNGAHFTGPGEVLQAAAAARRGDDVPLLRLAADADPANFTGDDLRFFSLGHNLARSCVDGVVPFDKSAPADVREAQFAAAYEAEPDFYGVISKEAWAAPGYLGFQPSPCIVSTWEDRPMYPDGTQVVGVPTLILGGEYDVIVPESVSQMAADVMVDSTYVGLAAAGHDPQLWSECGRVLLQRFIATLDAGDTSCQEEPAGGWWVPGSFPARAAQAPQATQVDGQRAPASLRRLVTVAAWTMMDSVQHNFFVPGDGVALRGGVVDFEPIEDGASWTLDDAMFTEDVRVDGVVTETGTWEASLTVSGPGRTVAEMHFVGDFLVDGAEWTVTVDSGRRSATFTVPAF